jgi:hypothetical protein
MNALSTLDKGRWAEIEREQPLTPNLQFSLLFSFHWLYPAFSVNPNCDEHN